MSSIVVTGSLHLTVAGSGLIGQQRLVNLPYCCWSLYRADRSDRVGFLDKQEYCFLEETCLGRLAKRVECLLCVSSSCIQHLSF